MNKSLPNNLFLKHSGISICYEVFGDPNNPCVILIMGIEGQLINWPIEFTQGLANKGFYVITFDNRDVGLSSYYDQLETPNISDAIAAKQQGKIFHPPYILKNMASDVIVLMDGLHIEKAHIAGISMGGMIAQILALDYPERLLSLTCIASTSGDSHLPPAKPEVLQLFFSPRKQTDTLESYVDNKIQTYKAYLHPNHFNEEKVRELAKNLYQRAYHPDGFKRQLLAVIFAEPRGEKLKKLKLKSLIVHGDYDPAFPVEHGKYLAECLPNSHLEIIEKLGHGLPACICEKLVELIDINIK
jgi:pimeloyl-ACP methyl ester carboxylesterase